MILVLLGTQNNSFKRLLEEVEKCIENKIIKEEVIVQAGATKYETKNMKIFDMISIDEMDKLLEQANLVITHGGVGSIIGAIKKEKKVIAVPRLHKYKEHVNDHQLDIIKAFSKKGYIKGIENVEELRKAIEEIDDFTPNKFKSNTNNIIEIIEKFIEEN